MSEDEVVIGISLPLDSDGFLRRECPTCEREFKWLPAGDGDSDGTPEPDGGYFCPYCAIQSSSDAWWTPAQLELAQNKAMREVVGPMLHNAARDINRSSGGLISMRATVDVPDEEMDPLTESDDMRRVDFACHPDERVKVLEDWNRPVHCLICCEAAA